MAVAFDAVGSSTGTATATPSTTPWLTWTHPGGASASAVIVGLAWGSTAFPPTVSSITYGGVAMTALGSIATNGTASNGGVLLYGLAGIPGGSQAVLVKTSANPTDVMIGNSISFTGAAAFGTAVAASGGATPVTVAVGGTAASSVVVAVEAHGTNGTVTYTAGAKQFDDEVDAASGASNLSGGTVAGGGSGTITATIPTDVWGAVAVEVQSAPPPPQAAPPFVQPPGLQSPYALTPWSGPIAPQPVTPPPKKYIAGMAGSGKLAYFTDQYGQPRLLLHEQAWALPWNAGRWNGGNWQGDMDSYFQSRGQQGYTGWFGTAWSDNHVDAAALSGGRTWDGIYPLVVNGTPGKVTTGSETITLNDPFWQRIDYLFKSALQQGVTCFLNLGMQYDFSGTNNIFFNLSTTQANTFGQLIAARYPQSSWPNVFWFFGDDGSGGQDAFFTQMVSGLATGGDTRSPVISVEQLPETNCHIEFDTQATFVASGFGVTQTLGYNWVYTYDPNYNGVEKSYAESPGTYQALPAVYGDGVWYGDGTSSGVRDYTIRRFTWWALSSGVRGLNNTSGPTTGGDVWQWQANAVADLASDPNGTWITGHIGQVAAYFTGLANWHQLIPDTGNVLVTAGRGTKTTNDAPGFNAAKYGDADNYVSASRVADGSLAVIYCGQFMSITIDQAQMAPGYTATWVDPASLATQAAATGSTYNSTPLGNNSAGNPDWALVLQGAPAAMAGTLPVIAPGAATVQAANW